METIESSWWLLIFKFFRANGFINKFSTFILEVFIRFKFKYNNLINFKFKPDEDLQYIGRKFVNKTICSEEFQN